MESNVINPELKDFPTGILEPFKLWVKGKKQIFFKSKQLELLWNDADVIHHRLSSSSDKNFGIFSIDKERQYGV